MANLIEQAIACDDRRQDDPRSARHRKRRRRKLRIPEVTNTLLEGTFLSFLTLAEGGRRGLDQSRRCRRRALEAV